MGGYTFDSDNNACNNKVTDCDNGICTLCPFGYTLNGISCTQCEGNCSRCDLTNTSKCTSCIYGQYLENSTCLTCPVGCLHCTNSQTCLTCFDGYILELPDIRFSPHVCQKCKYPCATCIINAEICTSCREGFFINGWQCLATYNFGLQVRLSTNITNFFKNYYSFLLSVVATMQTQNIDLVSVYNIIDNRLNASFDNV